MSGINENESVQTSVQHIKQIYENEAPSVRTPLQKMESFLYNAVGWVKELSAAFAWISIGLLCHTVAQHVG